MVSTGSPEASEIRSKGRRRLIGAVALVVLLVVFVPMVLDSEPRPVRDNAALTIPSKDTAAPLPAPPPAPKVVAAEPQKVEPAPAAVEKPATPAAPPKPSAAVEPPAVAPALSGFAVQVGAFRDEAKLKQAREKLAAANVVHYTERLETSSGPLTRLRAGPYPTREAAETALVSIKRGALDGKVVSLP